MKRWFILLFSSVFLTSCIRNEKTIGSYKNPLVIGLSYSYYENLSERDFYKLKNRLEKDLGLKVDFKTIKDSVDILEEIGRKRIDIAFLTLNEYLIAREYYYAEPKIMILRREKEDFYYGAIITNRKDINKIEDLDHKKVAARSPYSISGFILPSIVFSKAGIKPQFIFTDSHDVSLEKLMNNEVDAACVYKSLVLGKKGFKIVYEFGPIPNEPVVCRKSLDKFLCNRVVNEFMLLVNDVEFKGIFEKMAGITGFVDANPSDYKDIHKLIKDNFHSIYLLVPQGIVIKKLSEEYRID